MIERVILALLLVSAGVTGGCLADEQEPVAPANTSSQPDTGPLERWNRTITGSSKLILAAGTPMGPREVTAVIAGCGMFTFPVPEGTGNMTVTVSGPPINESRPGAGYQTFKVKHEAHDRYRGPPSEGDPAAERTVQVDQPRSGDWLLWIWPWGPTLNQSFAIEIWLSGQGAPPMEELELVPGELCG